MITVAIADSDEIFRKKLAEYISGYADLKVIHEAADGDGFLRPLRPHTLPDVALIDDGLPEEYALRITGNFHAYEFKTKIVILSGQPSGMEAEKAIEAGAVSYVDKAAGLPVIITAIRSCHRNKTYIYLKKGHWLQRLIGNKLGINLLHIFPKRKEKDMYSKLLKKGFSKGDIHSALHKYFIHQAKMKKEDQEDWESGA